MGIGDMHLVLAFLHEQMPSPRERAFPAERSELAYQLPVAGLVRYPHSGSGILSLKKVQIDVVDNGDIPIYICNLQNEPLTKDLFQDV